MNKDLKEVRYPGSGSLGIPGRENSSFKGPGPQDCLLIRETVESPRYLKWPEQEKE